MQAVISHQKGGGGGGSWSLAFHASRVETDSATACVIMYSLFVNNIIYKMLCFAKKFLVHLAYKDVDHFHFHYIA